APQGGGRPGSPIDALPADLLPLFGEIGALILLLVLAVIWCFPRQAALAFSESEIAFLFPAPVSRRMLVHYRLLGAQFGIFFTAIIFTLVFGRGRGFGAHAWYQFIGWSRLLNRSITSVRRRAITIGAGAAVVLALVVWIVLSVRLPSTADFSSAPH